MEPKHFYGVCDNPPGKALGHHVGTTPDQSEDENSTEILGEDSEQGANNYSSTD